MNTLSERLLRSALAPTDLLVTVAEAAALLRCGQTKVYELLADGILVRGPRYGRQTVITRESVEAALLAPAPSAPVVRKVTRPKTMEEEAAAALAELRASRRRR